MEVTGWLIASFHVLTLGGFTRTTSPYSTMHAVTPALSKAMRCQRKKRGSLWLKRAINTPHAIGSSRVNVLYSIASIGAAETARPMRHAFATTSTHKAITAIVRTL